MTGRRLYEHHCDALWASKTTRWSSDTRRYERQWPVFTPPAWPFLNLNEQNAWAELARRITPKPRKSRG